MSTLKDEAIVIRLTEYSETSQIATLFSAAGGLLRLIAKGARRSTRQRFSAGLDLLERGELGYVPPRGDAQLGTLTDWTQRASYTGLRRDLLRSYGGLYAAELVAGLTEEHDPHADLYAAFAATLDGLETADAPAGLVPRFQLALLRSIGYAPELERCTSCNRAVRASGPVFFSPTTGGLLCRDCEMHYFDKFRVPDGVLRATPDTGNAAAWFELLDRHLSHIAGKRFKTAAELGRLLAGRR